ncbi:unnamed protein product [Polarella glacialis]|uniref:Thioredoxin domain-containing protein n=1 Tax=Polarella glacialis TaxID=89957 RepID=A0A813GMK5_POLGL|nr:unnamed protein product [Polarella glacialis]
MFARRVGMTVATRTAARPVLAARAFASVGDKIPDVALDFGFPPEAVSMAKRCAGKKVIVVGLPGAFTPTCSTKSIPGYLTSQHALRGKGVDEVIIMAVNDGAVMKAWAKDQQSEGSMLTFMGDTRCEFSKALKLTIEPTPGLLGNTRCKRFSMYIDNGVIKVLNIAEGPGDPTGDGNPTVSFVEKMLADIK